VVAALTGRYGQVRSRRRWVLVGAVLVLGGAVLAGFGALRVREMLILAGLILAELGLVLVTPAFVGLITAAGRSLPLGPRIALRDPARNRAATAPPSPR
jgi:putative ABC transport system permease protein